MAEKPNRAATEIAQEANAHILALEERLHEVHAHAAGLDEDPIGLFCECGCMGFVTSTSSEYARKGGVWLEGHEPPRPSD